MPTIAVANPTPASGKSTTAVALARQWGRFGARVLLVDLDPEGDLTAAVQSGKAHDVYALLTEGRDLAEGSAVTSLSRVDLLASSASLRRLPERLPPNGGGNDALKRLFGGAHTYSYVLLDSPPSLDWLTLNALAAADMVLVPAPCEPESLEEIPAFLEAIERVRAGSNPGVHCLLLPTMDDGSSGARRVRAELQQLYPRSVLTTPIPGDPLLSEVLDRPWILERESRGSRAYAAAAMELASLIVPAAS